jgi:hypothetical protein
MRRVQARSRSPLNVWREAVGDERVGGFMLPPTLKGSAVPLKEGIPYKIGAV